MPTCTLTTDDLQQLSPASRAEVLGLFGPKPTFSDSSAPRAILPWSPVPPTLMKRFMSGVSPDSKDLLKLIAQHDGKLKWSVLRSNKSFKFEAWQDLKGFQAGMNRRLRGLLDDAKAIFVSWDEDKVEYDDDDNPVDGFLTVNPETAQALREYFAIA